MTLPEGSGVRKRNYVLAISLVVNIILASSAVFLVYQNSILTSRMSDLDRKTGELDKELYALQQKYELSQYQLQYYRSWAGRYWNASGYTPTASGLVGRSSINIVAVGEVQTSPFETSYTGFTMTAEVEIRHGEGRLLINTHPKIGIDLQASGETAETVVEKLTGVSFQSLDVILTVRAESDVGAVDGPSAGAAITICMIAALQNRTTDHSVFITGTVNPDGTIGKVGGIPYKALAAAQKGATLFLVPPGQINFTTMVEKDESPMPGVTIVTYDQVQINLRQFLAEQGYNVRVTEVGMIMEAYNQFVS
jgi:uncharacterized protein